MERFPVVIIGAGPGGCSAALQLNKMDITCLLLDKAFFPREKVCGDAISGKAITILNRIDQNLLKRFEKQKVKKDIWGIRMFAPNRIFLDVPFKWGYDIGKDEAPGAVARRVDLDNFLVESVRQSPNAELLEGIEVESIVKTKDSYRIKDKKGELDVEAEILLIANGANSKFTRQLAGIKKENAHFAAAVRAYYKNVEGFHPDGFIELHFLKEYIPGYFWIFPMPGNKANVGLGLRSDYVSKRKMNLRKTMEDIVENYPGIKERFKDAKLIGKINGHPLPLGSKKYKRSGDRFMLIGDAAHLIDPITGEGVGNAMYSGWIAGEQVGKCFEKDRFDAKEMISYDKRVQRTMGVELKLSYNLQKLVRFQFLINLFARRMDKHQALRKTFIRMYSDIEVRKKLVKPGFWVRVLSGRINK